MDRIWKVYRLTHYFGRPEGAPMVKRTYLFTVHGGTFDAACAQAIARYPSLAERGMRNLEVCGDWITGGAA